MGRRPKRSESVPRTGSKTNCINAQMVPKSPYILSALSVFPPIKLMTNLGRTGAIIPSASISNNTVKKIKTRAARRGLGDKGPWIVGLIDESQTVPSATCKPWAHLGPLLSRAGKRERGEALWTACVFRHFGRARGAADYDWRYKVAIVSCLVRRVSRTPELS